MKKSFNKIFSFLLLLTVATNQVTTIRADEAITKEYTFTSENSEEKADGHFKSEINENGKKYKLKDITYTVIDKEEVQAESETNFNTEYGPVKIGEKFQPDKTVTKDGIEYTLDSTVKKKVTIEEAYTQTVTGYTDYTKMNDAYNAPDTKSISAVNDKTGENVSTVCSKTGITEISSNEWEDTYIDIKFIAYDADEFIWNGIKVKKNENNPLKGYEDELLESVGGNTKNYKILKIYWTGKAYKNDDGILCRDAKADVQRKINRYRVSYQGSISVKPVKGYVYTSTYKGIKKTNTGKILYTIKAVASYEKDGIPVVGITIGMLFLIIIIVGILYIIRKKKA